MSKTQPQKIEEWKKFPPDKRSRWWERLVDILEEEFPKKKCKERGQALVVLAYAEIMFQEAEKEIKSEKEKLLERIEEMKYKDSDFLGQDEPEMAGMKMRNLILDQILEKLKEEIRK